MKEVKPEHCQKCLTKMKQGLRSGNYDQNDNTFYNYYYWKDTSWKAQYWVPIEEVNLDY